MNLRHVPRAHPRPDAGAFIDTLSGRTRAVRTPLVEYLVDDVVMRPIVTRLLGRTWVTESADREACLDNTIAFWLRMGYDFVRIERSLGFPINQICTPDSSGNGDRQRWWADEHEGTIRNWEDFEQYPWPALEAMDFFPFEYLNRHLPEGMGLIISHGGGVFEHLTWIMSLEGLCYALYDQPALVRAVVNRLGELMAGFYEQVLDLDRVIAVFPGDDMGFRTGTLVSPATLRELILPWHQRFARQAHARGVPYFLHCCGNVERIMEDLITMVGIDGKHSFEEVIMPVQDFFARYGNRLAVLGGMDVDLLAAATPEQVRNHARFLIESCGGGRYALGSGNSIPNYVPVENYLAMVDEAFEVQMR